MNYYEMDQGELCQEVLKHQVDSYHFDSDDFIVKIIDKSMCCVFHCVNGNTCGLAYSFAYSWGFVGKLIADNKIAITFMHGANQWRATSNKHIRVQCDCPLKAAIICYLTAMNWNHGN
ncbi:hypothetical protein NVP1174O_16 [Vibrio phage 1.174.O._10N.261.55.A8]|nr:hypothetical protein NVP1174O_16 [Vibrio phage 1.174.O._10N.261.55.A8]